MFYSTFPRQASSTPEAPCPPWSPASVPSLVTSKARDRDISKPQVTSLKRCSQVLLAQKGQFLPFLLG